MKTLKFTTYWTTEQAEDIYLALEEFKSAIWQSYGEDIIVMRKKISREQQEIVAGEFNNELPL